MAYYMYLSIAGDEKIAIYAMDPETGALNHADDVPLGGSPGPLAVDPAQKYLYAGIRSTRQIASFRLDPGTGGLRLFAEVGLEADPCYITPDKKGRFLLSAYYSGGLAAVHPINPSGAVTGPHIEWLKTKRCAHCIMTDRSNRFAFLPHVAESNVIVQFLFDEETGRLTPNATPLVRQEPDAGPRHYDFHPGLDVVYFSNEQGSSITAYHLDPDAGTLDPFQTLSTLPDSFDGENTCAQIHIAPSGNAVYVSNRGHDSIACFGIDTASGELTSLGQQPTEETPRAFNIDPQGKFLFAAGQGSGRLASYRIEDTGALAPLEVYEVGKSPSWVMVVRTG